MRFGLASESLPENIFKVVGILFLLLFAPITINQIKNRLTYLNISLSLLFGLLIFSAIGYLIKYHALPALAGWSFSIAGVIIFVVYLIYFLQTTTWVDYFVALPLTLIFALCNACVIYANFAKPELFEALAAGHIAQSWRTDTLYHTTL
ncbi:MAG: hypothetical protein ACKO96_38275, partial [Flammeovirgaceae bacterium]